MNINICFLDGFLGWLWGILNTNFIACGVSLLIAGFLYYDAHQQSRASTTWGFYANMKTFIKRLRPHLGNETSQHRRPLSQLSAIDEIRNNYIMGEKHKAQLLELSKDILDYLSHAPNQIPPKKNQTRDTWLNDIEVLKGYLIEFFDIDLGKYNCKYNNEQGVINAHVDLDSLLERMTNMINDEEKRMEQMQKNLFKRMFNSIKFLFNRIITFVRNKFNRNR